MSNVISASARVVHAGISDTKRIAASYGPQITEATSQVFDTTKECLINVANWGVQNPLRATCATVCGAGIVMTVTPALVSVPVLSAIGFTPGGVAAGTSAAAIQGTIGNVGAGSVFAIVQSAGAGGAGLAVVNGAVQGGGAVMALSSGTLSWRMSKL